MRTAVHITKLVSGEVVPVLGQGTWHMGDDRRLRKQEIAALRLGLDLGLTLIDTAEMYGSGAAEELVGEAITGRRDEVFLVSKVLPENATARGTVAACEKSLTRLGTDRLDLYLLHWRGSVPLAETLEGFAALKRAGKIRHWGVSNFDVDVAYSPIEQGRLLKNGALRAVAKRHDATPAQMALAWVLRREGVIAIPKAASETHVRENRRALDVQLISQDLAELDRAFPPPGEAAPLEMI
jgi:diketogulonate reductase-like aldo/keto reductase